MSVLMFCLYFLLGTKFDIGSVCFFFFSSGTKSHESVFIGLLFTTVFSGYIVVEWFNQASVLGSFFSEYLINLIIYIV